MATGNQFRAIGLMSGTSMDGIDAAFLETDGRLTEPLLEHFCMRQRAHVVVSGDTPPQRKPHPAPLLHAAEKLGVAPAECIYIGDAERDVLAAQAAGMQAFVALFGYIPTNEQPHAWPASGWLDTPQALATLLGSIVGRSQYR